VRSIFERSSLRAELVHHPAHSTRAARSLATSMKKFMPMPKKKLSRGAKSSSRSPRPSPLRVFLAVGDGEGELLHRRRPGLVHVIAEIEIELNFGISPSSRR
jgi:hypothetical protein